MNVYFCFEESCIYLLINHLIDLRNVTIGNKNQNVTKYQNTASLKHMDHQK